MKATFFGFVASVELAWVVVLPSVTLRALRPTEAGSELSKFRPSVRVTMPMPMPMPKPRPTLSSAGVIGACGEGGIGAGVFEESVLAWEFD